MMRGGWKNALIFQRHYCRVANELKVTELVHGAAELNKITKTNDPDIDKAYMDSIMQFVRAELRKHLPKLIATDKDDATVASNIPERSSDQVTRVRSFQVR